MQQCNLNTLTNQFGEPSPWKLSTSVHDSTGLLELP